MDLRKGVSVRGLVLNITGALLILAGIGLAAGIGANTSNPSQYEEVFL